MKNSPLSEVDEACIWKPSVYMQIIQDARIMKKDIMPRLVYINTTNYRIEYVVRYALHVSCDINLREYPVDKQNCTLEFSSREYLF